MLTRCLQFSSEAEPEKWWLKHQLFGQTRPRDDYRLNPGSQIGYCKFKEHKPFQFFSQASSIFSNGTSGDYRCVLVPLPVLLQMMQNIRGRMILLEKGAFV